MAPIRPQPWLKCRGKTASRCKSRGMTCFPRFGLFRQPPAPSRRSLPVAGSASRRTKRDKTAKKRTNAACRSFLPPPAVYQALGPTRWGRIGAVHRSGTPSSSSRARAVAVATTRRAARAAKTAQRFSTPSPAQRLVPRRPQLSQLRQQRVPCPPSRRVPHRRCRSPQPAARRRAAPHRRQHSP